MYICMYIILYETLKILKGTNYTYFMYKAL